MMLSLQLMEANTATQPYKPTKTTTSAYALEVHDEWHVKNDTAAGKLLTYRATAEALGVPYYKIQRAARAGLFPTYRVFNGRRLLKLSEVVAVIDRSREGGAS